MDQPSALGLLSAHESKIISYGTFQPRNGVSVNSTSVEKIDDGDTTFDKYWRHCERLLMYFGTATIDQELEQLKLDVQNR